MIGNYDMRYDFGNFLTVKKRFFVVMVLLAVHIVYMWAFQGSA
jgi:hypothetical protein